MSAGLNDSARPSCAYDGTPVLDLKPYIRGLDSRPEANNGWITDLDDHDHLLHHLRGKPHDHHHDHDHNHDHEHDHGHDHHDHHHGHHHDHDEHD